AHAGRGGAGAGAGGRRSAGDDAGGGGRGARRADRDQRGALLTTPDRELRSRSDFPIQTVTSDGAATARGCARPHAPQDDRGRDDLVEGPYAGASRVIGERSRGTPRTPKGRRVGSPRSKTT